jgi:hypothetical protein
MPATVEQLWRCPPCANRPKAERNQPFSCHILKTESCI